MARKIKITAVSGWALAPEWFREVVKKWFPEAEVRAIYPHDPSDPQEARDLISNSPADLYIGYSLGSLWLLHHRSFLPKSPAIKALLAPILAFVREANMGGKTSSTQLKYFRKLLLRNYPEDLPLADFYSRCEIKNKDKLIKSIPDQTTLIKGLDFLINTKISGNHARDFVALLGEHDSFLDPNEMRSHIPHLEIVKGTGHAPDELLKSLSQKLSQR